MNDHDVSWVALVPLALLAAAFVLCLEIFRIWPGRSVRPDLVWCLVFFAARRTAPPAALAAAFVCGLARDLTLGPKLGAATAAYVASVWAYTRLREAAAGGGFAQHAVLAGALAAFACVSRTLLDLGGAAADFRPGQFLAALGDGAATLAAYPAAHLLLSLPFLSPTRARRRPL